MNGFELNIVHCLNAFFENSSVYPAAESRGGLGRLNEAYLLSWSEAEAYYRDTTGISRDDFKKGIQLVRSSGRYIPESMYPKEFVQL